MAFLDRRHDERLDCRQYLPGCRSVICLAINYHTPVEAAPPAHGKVAQYAMGLDYHEPLKTRLYKLADWICSVMPEAQCKCSCDTAPVLEREHAAKAGIGWVGKNTLVIHPKLGSYLLLAEIFTTLDLPIDQPMADHCGTCTRCLDACPTQAIVAPHQLDATRCISYLNIEHTQPLDDRQQTMLGEWLFGCDICQQVCPFNRFAPESDDNLFRPRWASGSLALDELQGWDVETYRSELRKSPMRRIKLPVLKQHAQAVQKNRNAVAAD